MEEQDLYDCEEKCEDGFVDVEAKEEEVRMLCDALEGLFSIWNQIELTDEHRNHIKRCVFVYISKDQAYKRFPEGKGIYIPPDLYTLENYRNYVNVILDSATEVVHGSKFKGYWGLAQFVSTCAGNVGGTVERFILCLCYHVRSGCYERPKRVPSYPGFTGVLDLLDGKTDTYTPAEPKRRNRAASTRKRKTPSKTTNVTQMSNVTERKPRGVKKARTMNDSKFSPLEKYGDLLAKSRQLTNDDRLTPPISFDDASALAIEHDIWDENK